MVDIVIGAIKPELVDIVWPLVHQHILMATQFSNDELNVDQIKESIKNGVVLLLVVYKDGKIIASCTIEKRTFDSGKVVVHISTLGGSEMELWADKMDKAIESVALEQGCNELYIIGRKGWDKYLKKRGYNHVHTVLCKKIGV